MQDNTRLFTPRKDAYTNERYQMHLSPADFSKIGRGRWTATVTDQDTGIAYKVRGASCGLPRCMCDAVVVKQVS